MDRSEFSEAVDAYLGQTANSWQEFIVEDYYESYSHCFDILDLLDEAQIKEISDRVFKAIMKRIRESDGN
ncbi:hypothetical protein SAMN06265348_11832 [Pedobacter westerhofensis]|uniref:Phage protein n=1 Tax=Pedobacter westerhofensis TaxID=425512 RepID=A0A521FS46_9SPHI|nr:hypothetical protein [Pedobacter westerhofensis]SMO98904.1 hypothetical protein SAMN06265348_11832 [Pedobacter westerhofensis]